jgi:hypothetical protein
MESKTTRRVASATSPCWRTAIQLVEEAMDKLENPWSEQELQEDTRIGGNELFS